MINGENIQLFIYLYQVDNSSSYLYQTEILKIVSCSIEIDY